MRILTCSLLFWIVLASPLLAQTVQTGDLVISSPRPGDVLQGVVIITGSDNVEGFVEAEVTFSYTDDPTGTWFMITMTNQPVTDDRLATWDTTRITDGNYVLRLRVSLTDGSVRETTVTGLRVRNYTPAETATPTQVIPTETVPTAVITITTVVTSSPTITETPRPFATPTALPVNPASLAPTEIYTSVIYGGLAVIVTFVLFGLYLRLRRK